VQSSANRLTRLLGIDSDPVNHGWLCDKGRFVFESTNGDEVATGPAPAIAVATAADEVDVVPATASQAVSLGPTRGQFAGEARSDHSVVSNRLTEPLVRKGGELVPTSWGEALGVVAEHLGASKSEHGAGSIGVLGGARLTNEGAYAWAKLAKGILGTDSVDAQLRRRAPRRAGLRPAARHHRRGVRRHDRGAPGRRRARGAAGAVPALARPR